MKGHNDPSFQLFEELEIELSAASAGFHAYVIGVKPGHCLILEHPFPESGAHRLKVKDAVWVRFIRHSVFRFRTQILRIMNDPLPLIFLGYPETIQEVKRREGERKKVFIHATYAEPRHVGEKRFYEGYILDLSKSGCLMWGDFAHLLDREILLTFRVPWEGDRIHVKARVVRCEATNEGTRGGMQFIDLEPAIQRRLEGFTDFLRQYQISRIVGQEPANKPSRGPKKEEAPGGNPSAETHDESFSRTAHDPLVMESWGNH